jgi:DNA-binding NtrC family response regulator
MDSPILVVDNSAEERDLIVTLCSSFSSAVDEAGDAIDALRLFELKRHALVIVDSNVQPMGSFELIVRMRKREPKVRCVLLADVLDQRLRAAVVQWEFLDVVSKPLAIGDIQASIRVALGQERGATHALSPVAMSNRMDECLALLGNSSAIGAVRCDLGEMIHTKLPILISGPVGIGKPYIASLIHDYGPYARSELVECRCNQMSRIDLSELLIGPKGRWGAILERARNTTLVLHYVETLPMEVQGWLADSFKKIAESMHVICLAYTSLDEELANGTIDDRLYFEISLCQLEIPKLADRPQDIEAIIHYIVRHHERYEIPAGYSDSDVEQLIEECTKLPPKLNVDGLLERVRAHGSDCVCF